MDTTIKHKRCAMCGESKPMSVEYFKLQWRNKEKGLRYFNSYCNPCLKIYENNRRRTRYADLPEWRKQIRRDATNRCRRRKREQQLCCCGAKVESTKFCDICVNKRRINGAQKTVERRNLVLKHYGRKCQCCGESRVEFLTLDHIGGWGRDHRDKRGKRIAGRWLVAWVIKNGFPNTIRLLCYNCNCSLGHRGYCPHELERSQSLDDTGCVLPNKFIEQRFTHVN